MGLDMFLYSRRYVWQPYGKETVPIKVTGIPWIKDPSKIKYVEQEEIYWRKCNAIHKWFVDNCQKGKDDCRDAKVSAQLLKNLHKLIGKVLEHKDNPKKAEELLPPEEGFFFGSTEIDEYYWEDIKRTEKELRKILSRNDLNEYEFIYHSSW